MTLDDLRRMAIQAGETRLAAAIPETRTEAEKLAEIARLAGLATACTEDARS